MTLRDAVGKLASTSDRIDTKSRLIGYLVLWLMNGRSWQNLGLSHQTPANVRKDLLERGVDIRDVHGDVE